MRIGCSLGSLLTIKEIQSCCDALSETDVDSIWIPETWGMENFSMLAAISGRTGATTKIGSSIINVFSRSPSVIAMGAGTVDTMCGGRLILGLGTSSVPIVEGFHGYKFAKPLRRMREYVEIIRLVLAGSKVNYTGDIFELKNFTLLVKPPRTRIPIYLAAVNKKMVDLAWGIGDGVIFYLRPISEMSKTISEMQSKREIDVACQIITCISDENPELAKRRARRTIAFYVSVGKVYREFLAKNGFASETLNIFTEFKKTGFEHSYKFVTDDMLASLAICGTAHQCKEQLKNFFECGVSLPILQFNPVAGGGGGGGGNNDDKDKDCHDNNNMKSFELFKKTFFGE